MTLRWLVAAVHLLGLGVGLGAIFARARAFGGPLEGAGLKRLFLADNFWALAAGLWLVTGLWRAFGGLEKGTQYYLHQPWFHLKITCFVVIVGLEIWPMLTLIKWRARAARHQPIATGPAPTFARISYLQAALVVLMVFAATAMARGLRF